MQLIAIWQVNTWAISQTDSTNTPQETSPNSGTILALRNLLLEVSKRITCSASALAGLALGLLLASTAFAQQNAPVTQMPWRKLPSQPDMRLYDHFVPLIEFEQHSTGMGELTQAYRIQIFKDGRGLYHGLNWVKQRGTEPFRLQPEQVKRIQTTLRNTNSGKSNRFVLR